MFARESRNSPEFIGNGSMAVESFSRFYRRIYGRARKLAERGRRKIERLCDGLVRPSAGPFVNCASDVMRVCAHISVSPTADGQEALILFLLFAGRTANTTTKTVQSEYINLHQLLSTPMWS